jgi:polysaccharide biosynthesis/export protein
MAGLLLGGALAVAQEMPASDAETLQALSRLSPEEREMLLRQYQRMQAERLDARSALDRADDPATSGGSPDAWMRQPGARGASDLRAPEQRLRRDPMDPPRGRHLGESDDPDDLPRATDRERRKRWAERMEPLRRFDRLSRVDQLATAKACAQRKRERLKVERQKQDEAQLEEQERGSATVLGSGTITLTPQEKERRALEDRMPMRCSDKELEDYLAHVNPFSRFSDRPQPFGYELFDQGEDSFLRPSSDLPVPVDYVLGPGDRVEVQLFGKENRRHVLTVTRDGVLQFPQLGPLEVAGMSFDDARELIQGSVAERMIGVQASVTLGPLRSIRVFVLGDVQRPGSYTVPAQSTVTNALFAAGGIRQTGSLRSVQVKRTGEVVSTLDLYDLLLRGDTSDDMALDAGDVVFVPAVGKTVSISGEVVRPATYEIKSASATVADLIGLAGGLLPTAYAQNAGLERIRSQTDRTLATLDLTQDSGRGMHVQSGDHLRVYSVFDRAENVVLLSGQFERPGLLQWTQGMRLSDAIPSLRSLRSGADTRYVLIRREVGPERRLQMISANPATALADPGSDVDLELHSRDQLIAFPADGSREEYMERVIAELHQQAGMSEQAQLVEIAGRVKSPGIYPLTTSMTVSDLVRAAGGGSDDAYPGQVELMRRNVVEGQRREITRVVVDLADPQAASTLLLPYDMVNVRPIEGWYKTEVVVLRGEVRLPGEYVIQPNETLESVIRRAGGFTPQAYLPGTVFSREEIRLRQQEELERQGRRLRSELLQVQLDYQGPDKKDIDVDRVRQLGALLAEELNQAQALGRVVIDMESALNGKKPVALRGGDTITVPRRPSEVTVLGEVSYPTTHMFQGGLDYDDYVELSGGYSARADENSAFVLRINGEVASLDRAGAVTPGDVVVVPFKVDRGRGLYITATIAQIIGQLAITAASFKTIGVF